VPLKPLPIVSALVAVAVTVTELPKATVDPLIVMELLVNDALAMLDKVLLAPLMVTPASVVIVPPRLNVVEPMTIELLLNDPLAMLDSVLLAPLIVLLVRVSVV